MLFALLTGCAQSPPIPKYDQVSITINLVDKISINKRNISGAAYCAGNSCRLEVLRSKYPRCILHEIRHAFEGNWHEGWETADYCDIVE